MANNLEVCRGGLYTRFDPSDPYNKDKMSCLDYVLVTPNLVKYIEFLEIDSLRNFYFSDCQFIFQVHICYFCIFQTLYITILMGLSSFTGIQVVQKK